MSAADDGRQIECEAVQLMRILIFVAVFFGVVNSTRLSGFSLPVYTRINTTAYIQI